jgi:SAM-dependent methyltransferase
MQRNSWLNAGSDDRCSTFWADGLSQMAWVQGCQLSAHRDILRCRTTPAATGAKRTLPSHHVAGFMGTRPSFDAAVSTQVYEYVVDIPGALAELSRVARPGGRAVVMDNDYGSLVIHTEHEARMKRVLSAWDEHFVHAGLPRTLSRQLRDAGFTIRQRDAIPMFNLEYRENTFGKGLLAIMATFAAGRKGVSQEEADAWLAEFAQLDKQEKFFFSLNRYLFVADKPATTG